jgi:hypothetical protein
MENNRCELHDQEIKQIKTDFSKFKVDVSRKIDELIMEARKPILTDKQWASLTIAAIIYVIGIVMYVGSTNSMANNNKDNMIKFEKEYEKDYDRIIEILLDIKEDVGVNKAK